jgi:hypothetical protein
LVSNSTEFLYTAQRDVSRHLAMHWHHYLLSVRHEQVSG